MHGFYAWTIAYDYVIQPHIFSFFRQVTSFFLALANWLQDRVVVKTYVTKANKVQPFTTVQPTRREGLGLKRDQKIDRERARVGSKRGKFLLFMVTSKTPRQQDKRATFLTFQLLPRPFFFRGKMRILWFYWN